MKSQKLKNGTEVTKDGKVVKVNQIKSLWKKAGTHLSLKAFARECLKTADSVLHEPARRWLLNKRANPKAPLKGIGRTHKPKAGTKPQAKSKD